MPRNPKRWGLSVWRQAPNQEQQRTRRDPTNSMFETHASLVLWLLQQVARRVNPSSLPAGAQPRSDQSQGNHVPKATPTLKHLRRASPRAIGRNPLSANIPMRERRCTESGLFCRKTVFAVNARSWVL